MTLNLDKHQSSPNITLEQHIKKERTTLGESLNSRIAIYLDTRFWIILRNAANGKTEKAENLKLLSIIRELVQSGQAFCPVSSSAFMEFFKQPRNRLEATAKIVDELSLGVALSDPITLQNAELFHFLRSTLETGDLHPLRNIIWTKIPYVMGTQVPQSTAFSSSDELAIQKAFYDHLGQFSFSEMLKTMGGRSNDMPPLPGSNPAQINSDIAKHAEELRSFEQTLRYEIAGVVDVCGGIAAEILHQIGCEKTGQFFEPSKEEWLVLTKAANNILTMEFKKPETNQKLKMMHIGASLHADLRWNKGQKFKPNDLIDFQHATEALAFCDVFLTERRLANAVTNRLHLDEQYDCKVCHLAEDACELLESIR